MTEMEQGHFAGTEKVVDASRQVASEQAFRANFQRYVDVAKPIVSSGRWLDIGCGGGLLLSLARDAGYEAEGIELTCDRRDTARSLGFTVHDKPVEDVGYPDGSFAVISLINVFSHLTRPLMTLSELRRILSPDGVLIIFTGEVGEGVERRHVYRWNLGDHLYFLGDRTMSEYAERIGLTIIWRDRTWLPERVFSEQSLRARGRSGPRNAVKSAIVNIPGALQVVRLVALRDQASNPVYSTVFALSKR
jgi:SAM-dependent methyltransferase